MQREIIFIVIVVASIDVIFAIFSDYFDRFVLIHSSWDTDERFFGCFKV